MLWEIPRHRALPPSRRRAGSPFQVLRWADTRGASYQTRPAPFPTKRHQWCMPGGPLPARLTASPNDARTRRRRGRRVCRFASFPVFAARGGDPPRMTSGVGLVSAAAAARRGRLNKPNWAPLAPRGAVQQVSENSRIPSARHRAASACAAAAVVWPGSCPDLLWNVPWRGTSPRRHSSSKCVFAPPVSLREMEEEQSLVDSSRSLARPSPFFFLNNSVPRARE